MLNRYRSLETRHARRMARIARWDRPIEGATDRLMAWANMVLADHGMFRLFYLNHHRLNDKLWRSAQPAPHQFAWFAKQGIRTIINLRGGREHGSWQLQKDACDRLGLTLVEFPARSRGAPERDTILKAKEFFDGIAYPALIHCKSGADRSGFASALYLLAHEGATVAEARRHLSFRYLHLRRGRAGVLGHILDLYEARLARGPIGVEEWFRAEYDADAAQAGFRR